MGPLSQDYGIADYIISTMQYNCLQDVDKCIHIIIRPAMDSMNNETSNIVCS